MGTRSIAAGDTGAEPNAVPAEIAARALEWAAERAGDARGRSGERYVDHARATIGILRELGVDEPVLAAAALVSPAERLPLREIEAGFGSEVARLVDGMRQIQRLRELHSTPGAAAGQVETLRRMLLAMATDIRVVLLRLASRLHTLRYHAAQRRAPDAAIARETIEVLAPLANRLGLWQLKWELEDLAFRFLDPDTYRELARQLEERRVERETSVATVLHKLQDELAAAGLRAEVSGRPKHLYSIYNKMRSKRRSLDEISDLRGLRVIVDTVAQCYAALGVVHAIWTQVPHEFDDYIARPKPNGYRSLHTVVLADDGRPLEVQIRTREMHRFAEYGVASHWRYKEQRGGAPARGGRAAAAGHDEQIAWMRQLLAWQREVGQALGNVQPAAAGAGQPLPQPGVEERIYVLTPQARVIELPAGATPIDFAYHVHTSLGHRCRGARIDGQMVPLNTPLQSGQTVEIVAAKETGHEGPSRDWLNPQLGYVRSPRTRNKVRQWFNALELERDAAAGRERVERVLQREGRTALAFDELARRLGFDGAPPMFLAVARDEIGPRQLEEAVRGPPAGASQAGASTTAGSASVATIADGVQTLPLPPRRRATAPVGRGAGVLVVGIDSLMTQLARCCRPVPPDAIVGFVTKGRGVSVHRDGCATFARMADRAPERVIETAWGDDALHGGDARTRRFPADVEVRATDRPGLLRDITEVFARDRLNVTAVQTLSRQQLASMRFTVEVPDATQLARTLSAVREVAGVIHARRR